MTFDEEFRINTVSFPPVFAGTLLENTNMGHYDPVYPPGGVNLHWWYPEWPEPAPPGYPDDNLTQNQHIGHVGEYNGAYTEGEFVYMTWTDNRLSSPGTLYGRRQSDIRLLRLVWPQ